MGQEVMAFIACCKATNRKGMLFFSNFWNSEINLRHMRLWAIFMIHERGGQMGLLLMLVNFHNWANSLHSLTRVCPILSSF